MQRYHFGPSTRDCRRPAGARTLSLARRRRRPGRMQRYRWGAGRGNRGYSLIEMTVVLGLIAVASQGFVAYQNRLADDAVVNRTVDAVARIDEALIAYRLDVGAWPANINLLSAYLPNFDPVNGAGFDFTIRSVPPNLVLDTYVLNERQRTAIHQSFPANSVALGAALGTCTNEADCGISLGVGIPGLETSHQALFLQDGSEPFLGNLDMDGNEIQNVSNLVFSSAVVTGTSCTAGSVATTATGEVVSCIGGTWASGVVLDSGSATSGTVVYPPTGFVAADCNISVSGRPVNYAHQTHKGWRHYSMYTTPSGTGWEVNAGVYAYTSGGSHTGTASASVQYQIVCVR